jgi:hypothetical protein
MRFIWEWEELWGRGPPGLCKKKCNVCRALEDAVVQLWEELEQPIPPEARPNEDSDDDDDRRRM